MHSQHIYPSSHQFEFFLLGSVILVTIGFSAASIYFCLKDSSLSLMMKCISIFICFIPLLGPILYFLLIATPQPHGMNLKGVGTAHTSSNYVTDMNKEYEENSKNI